MDKQFAEFNDMISQAREVALPFGISLFDVILLIIVFLIVNKVLEGRLIEAIKAKLATKPVTPTPVDPVVVETVVKAPTPVSGVEGVYSTLIDNGIPPKEAEAFVKENWEQLRSKTNK